MTKQMPRITTDKPEKKIIVSENESMNNPSIFLGSSFGEFFQMLHKTGEYEQILIYTSQETKSMFGNDALLDFYKNMTFSYQIKLKANKNNVLYYETVVDATQSTLQMNYIIENDTCKAVFETLNHQKPFIGM